jgi:xylulokinase
MVDAVLGVDVGTGSLKAGLFDLDGKPLGIERAGYGPFSVLANAREQNPRDWWTALAATCRRLLDQAPPATRVLAVGVGGQAPTLVPTDADLQPTHRAITWLDPRTAPDAERLYARLGEPVPVWGSWPAQAVWFVGNCPQEMRRTRWLLGCPDYVVSRLIGRPVALLSLSTAELDAGDLDGTLFPPAWTPGAIAGEICQAAAEEIHLPAGTPVVGGHIDGLLGVLGSGVRQPGDACINSGTSGTFSVVCRPPLGYPMFGVHVAGTASNASGVALDWFAANISHTESTYAELLASAASVPPGALGLLFLPHLAGDRGAQSDANARGAWVGLTFAHDRRHLLRSLLEGVAFSFRSMQDWLEGTGAEVGDVRCVGGQAQSDVWNQIKADVLNRLLLVPEVVEAPVVGAAVLAAVGIGVYAEPWQAAQNMVHIRRRFEPQPQSAALYSELFAAFSSLYTALRETNWRLREASMDT